MVRERGAKRGWEREKERGSFDFYIWTLYGLAGIRGFVYDVCGQGQKAGTGTERGKAGHRGRSYGTDMGSKLSRDKRRI